MKLNFNYMTLQVGNKNLTGRQLSFIHTPGNKASRQLKRENGYMKVGSLESKLSR